VTTCETLVRDLLLRDPEINGAVGGTRIYPVVRPQATPLPAITYQRISRTRFDPLDEPGALADARLQIDCWAASYAAVKDLAADIQHVLNGYTESGTAPPALRAIRAYPDDRDDYQADPPVWRVSSDYSVFWEE
jgi:Protein of unknown function (DUF3168)